jgi:hypothetical protein
MRTVGTPRATATVGTHGQDNPNCGSLRQCRLPLRPVCGDSFCGVSPFILQSPTAIDNRCPSAGPKGIMHSVTHGSKASRETVGLSSCDLSPEPRVRGETWSARIEKCHSEKRSKSGSCLPFAQASATSAPIVLNVIPFPPHPRMAILFGNPSTGPMMGSPVGLTAKAPAQA